MSKETEQPPRTPKFWAPKMDAFDAADMDLSCTSIEEMVREYYQFAFDEGDEIPEEITARGYAPVIVRKVLGWDLAEAVLDSLDEEYGDPDGSATEPTPAMREAERVFLDAMRREYEPWACEVVEERVIRPRDYLDREAEG